MESKIKTIKIELGERSYEIVLGCGLLERANEYFTLDRKALIVTDSGVPKEYSERIASLCKEAKIVTFEEGEKNKNIDTFAYICKEMLTFNLQRKDAVVAVGGGVVGDIAGFAAAAYMRGIDFYNVPTTLLSMVDSSVGGKTAIDFFGTKNILGAFHQPRGVLIDTDVLKTLDKRQFSSGLAEVVKMSLTSDSELFSLLEGGLWKTDIAEIIARALMIKTRVVEADEKEGSLRKILNFGHTFGHGIEASSDLYHGECVALGMLPMSSEKVRKRLIPLLRDMNLPTEIKVDTATAFKFMHHDKKGDGEGADAVFVDEVGSFRMEKTPFNTLEQIILDYLAYAKNN